MSVPFAGRLPEPAQELLTVCDEIQSSGTPDTRFTSLLKYHHGLRRLHGLVNEQEIHTRALQDALTEAKWTGLAANQEQSAVKTAIDHFRRVRHEHLDGLAGCVPIIGELLGSLRQDDELPSRETVLSALNYEKGERLRMKRELEGKRTDVERLRSVLEQEQASRRKLASLLAGLTLSPQVTALLEHIAAALPPTPSISTPSTPISGEEPSIRLQSVFEQLCQTTIEPVPWERLRFFPSANSAEKSVEDGEIGERETTTETLHLDDLYYPLFAHVDQIRVSITGGLRLSVIVSADNRHLSARMDPIEYCLSEEQADAWLAPLLPRHLEPHGLLDFLQRVGKTWAGEEELRTECSSGDDSSSPFSEFRAIEPHHFSIIISSLTNPAASAKVTITTIPQPSYKIEPVACEGPQPSDAEAFATRCRLVQDRLNAPDMLASPPALQIAFLRKLVQ